jgi:hypothetical protein
VPTVGRVRVGLIQTGMPATPTAADVPSRPPRTTSTPDVHGTDGRGVLSVTFMADDSARLTAVSGPDTVNCGCTTSRGTSPVPK